MKRYRAHEIFELFNVGGEGDLLVRAEDVDTLEAKLAWAMGMLDRFCSLLENKPGSGDAYEAIFEYRDKRKQWLADLERGFKDE